MQIYTHSAGQRSGPHSLDEVQARLEARALSPGDLAWHEGSKDWIPLSQVPGLKMPENSAPPRLTGPPPLPVSTPPPLSAAASPAFHAAQPPPRKGLMIVCGVGTILLALVLLGTAASFLGRESTSHLALPGILLIPLSIGVGIVSIQFFCALSRNPTGCCKVCGQPRPTINGSLHRHIGAVVLMFHAHIRGHLCQECIKRIFWQFTPLTLAAGWWGIISFFVTPVVLVNNIALYVRSRFMK
jgi:hypothetical protein